MVEPDFYPMQCPRLAQQLFVIFRESNMVDPLDFECGKIARFPRAPFRRVFRNVTRNLGSQHLYGNELRLDEGKVEYYGGSL